MSSMNSTQCRKTVGTGLWLVLWLICLIPFPEAQGAVKVTRHALSCNTAFPCPSELRERTDFWIEVYSRWDSTHGIFHDSLYPDRVYSAIKVRNGCRSKNSGVKKERNRIKAQLNRIAATLAAGKKPTRKSDRELLDLFPKKTSKEVTAAAKRIRCQQGNRDRFANALKRYGAYGSLVKDLVVKAGLPEDIHYLPFVESLYNPKAYSRVGAAGLWQIMPRTARSLGLELNATVDERLDLEQATLGAVRYLKDSRNRLTAVAKQKRPSVTAGELSPFVITSYNYGVNGMRRALSQFGPEFITVLNRYKSPSFQVAVKNFYSSFLAARHVARNANQYFGSIKPDKPFRYSTVLIKRPTSMERVNRVFGLGEDELRGMNRALTRFVWHGWRLMPKGYRLRLPYRADGWKQQVARLNSLPPEDDSRRPVKYKVRKGDTACGIARAFRVKCKDLVDMNRLGRRAFIRVNQILVIPGKGGKAGSSRPITIATDGSYTVRRGDSPCGIAIRSGVRCADLLAANNLGKRAVIHPGQVLKVPVKGGKTKSVAPASEKTSSAETGAKLDTTEYTVKPHDTPCEIAERFRVVCTDFMRLNGLNNRSVLQIGQKLKLPGEAQESPNLGSSPDPQNFVMAPYVVRAGDTPCQIARRHGMECDEFQRSNNLKKHSVIYVGQTLKVKKAITTASATATESRPVNGNGDEDVAGEAATTPLDIRIDFRIKSEGSGESLRHFVNVEAEETLGHFADWLGIGSSAALKTLNKIGNNQLLITGQRLWLPVKTNEQRDRFGEKREEYHRVLVEEFKENYRVINVESYKVRKGDSPWRIADRFQLPLWVITRYNPELRRREPVSGEILRVPQVKRRG